MRFYKRKKPLEAAQEFGVKSSRLTIVLIVASILALGVVFWFKGNIASRWLGSTGKTARATAGKTAMTGQGTAAPEPGQPLPRKESYNLGYHVYDLSYTDAEGVRQPLVTAVWYPTDAEELDSSYPTGRKCRLAPGAEPSNAGRPFPLVIFCHDVYSGGLQSLYICEHLARNGYVVVACDFPDVDPADPGKPAHYMRIREGMIEPRRAMRKPFSISADLFIDYLAANRLVPAKTLINTMVSLGQDADRDTSLEKADLLKGAIDGGKVGIVGHGLGATTVIGLLANPDELLNDRRIGAAVVLSGSAFLFRDTIKDIKVPLMFASVPDYSMSQPAPMWQKPYELAQAPKYDYVLKDPDASVFADPEGPTGGTVKSITALSPARAAISKYIVAFFNHYLLMKGDDGELLLRKDDAFKSISYHTHMLKKEPGKGPVRTGE